MKAMPVMRKFGPLRIFVAVLALAACNPFQPAPTSKTPAAATETANLTPVAAACAAFSIETTPNPTETSRYPAITDQDWSLGSKTARVTLLEYSDFQCAYCATTALAINELIKEFPQDVRVVFRYFPQQNQANAILAAQAAEAAGLQGKFWEMHDALFTNQSTWMGMMIGQFETWLLNEASTIGLDEAKLKSDLNSSAVVKKITDAQAEAIKMKLQAAPSLVINGIDYSGPSDFANLSAFVKLVVVSERQFTSCPPMTLDLTKQYIATLHTEKGDIIIQLFAKEAPTAVNSFIFLAKNGWYDNVIFHRVIPGVIVQTGDPTGTGFGNPGYLFANEIYPGLKFDKAGLVGLANSGPDSNGSQFFIALSAQPDWDGIYPIFGQVISGMDVVNQLTPRDPAKAGDLPVGDKILSVSIDEN
jgi:cyclophilin family peptidyl-prolyl cis-trans isomerase/protein-disulfide isomerase